MRPRGHAGKILLALSVAAAGLAGLGFCSALHRARSTLERHAADRNQFLTEYMHRSPDRPCLFGDGEEGFAEVWYGQADRSFLKVMERGAYDINDPAEPGLDHLRKGTRCRKMEREWVNSLHDLLSAVCDRAGKLHSKGHDAEALERLRVVLAVIRDLELGDRHPRELAGIEMDAHALTLYLLEKHSLDASELRAHAEFLDRLETSRPDLLPAIHFKLDPWAFHKEPGWRHLFSDTLYQAAIARQTEAAFAAAKATLIPIEQRLQAIGRYPSTQPLWAVEEIFMIDGARRMYARLARVGVELAAQEREQGRFPDRLPPELLTCPNRGQALIYRPKEGLVYSPGFDQIDNGGTPVDPSQWTHWPDLRYKAKGDLVVRVRRKP